MAKQKEDFADLIVGSEIREYERMCKEAFKHVRKLKKLGIGQPWIDIAPAACDPDDIILPCRIRLEVR
jgi:hypothetical protein